MPGTLIPFYLRSAKHPTDAIAGARMATIRLTTVVGEDQGEATAEMSPESIEIQKTRIDVTLMGKNPTALRALIGAAANLVLAVKGAAGANELETLKNIKFHTYLGEMTIRDPDSGGPVGVWGVAGTMEALVSDTPALGWVSSADA